MKETTVFTKEKDQTTDFIPETVTSSTGVEVKSKKLGFDLSAFAHLRTVLTELYADAEYAVIRELLSNAIDSHVKAKTDAPVEIELPSAENNYTLTVQDYGTGMSLIEIDERFCNYGGSDKRDDAKTIGRYGLGSKSPLAIANRYDIASIKDGEKVEFHMGSDDFDDASNDFQIHYDNITATDELNGVKIVVPYPKNVYLSPNMLSVLFAGVPNLLVNGKQWNTSLYNEDVFKRVYDVDQNVQMFYNTTEKDARSEFATLNIVLGKVVYPLEIRKLETALYSNSSSEFQEQKEKYQKVLSMVRKLDENTKFKSFFITVPLSFLKPTPSRESLYYTHETVNVMMSFIEKAFTALKEQNEVALNQLNSYKEAREFVYSWQPLFNGEALWRNEKVLLNFDPFYMQKKYNFGHVYKTYTATKTVRHRTVTLKTKELKPIVDNSIDIVNLNPKTLVVQLPLNLIDAAKLMERIKTRFGVIRGEKWEDVLFLPFDYYNNPWWNFSEAYDEEIVTAEQLYRFILKTAKEKRDTVKQEKPLKYNQLVVAVESDPAKKNLIAYRIEPVYKDSEALNKPILYATERDNVNAFTAGDYSYSHRDYWSFYKDNIGDKYTILVVNPRQKLDLFLKTYPDAVRVSEVTKKILEEKSASKVEVTWNDLSRVLVGYEKTQLEKIMAAYVYCYEAGLVSYYEGLENFVQLKARTDSMEADTVVELYKNYANGRISVDKITPWGEEARKIINKFSMFSALTQRGEIKYLNEDRVKILASVFVQERSL